MWGVEASCGDVGTGEALTNGTVWVIITRVCGLLEVLSCLRPSQGHHAQKEAAEEAAGGQEAHASARSRGGPPSRLPGRAATTRLTRGGTAVIYERKVYLNPLPWQMRSTHRWTLVPISACLRYQQRLEKASSFKDIRFVRRTVQCVKNLFYCASRPSWGLKGLHREGCKP